MIEFDLGKDCKLTIKTTDAGKSVPHQWTGDPATIEAMQQFFYNALSGTTGHLLNPSSPAADVAFAIQQFINTIGKVTKGQDILDKYQPKPLGFGEVD